ncbi:hypothetical protein [uncultured Parvimonas sp.]|uniref:hypothetical protein n=1 Tax=uncultured Parvimonas sp. TaxID=747372 RepID=UPI002594580B|nr:hypothetical protein [uncultured Parvimonas sp.]
MAEAKKDEIIFGAGEVYITEYTEGAIPEHNLIETEENNVGHCQGGFTVEYKPETYEVKNQYGKTVRKFLKGEDISAKTGVLSWDLKRLAELSTAKFTEDKSKHNKKLTFGGSGKSFKTVILRFVHIKEDGKKLRFTMIGQAGNGFSIEFADKELVIDAEIQAIEKVKNFLAEIEEETGE